MNANDVYKSWKIFSSQFDTTLSVFRYKCVARNQGEASAEGQLIVKSVTTIVRGPSDRTETLGSEVRPGHD